MYFRLMDSHPSSCHWYPFTWFRIIQFPIAFSSSLLGWPTPQLAYCQYKRPVESQTNSCFPWPAEFPDVQKFSPASPIFLIANYKRFNHLMLIITNISEPLIFLNYAPSPITSASCSSFDSILKSSIPLLWHSIFAKYQFSWNNKWTWN